MVFVRLVVVALVHVFLILLSKEGAHAVVRINEIADKGSDGVCEGEDWIELYNDSPNAVQLDGYVLHDDQYPENAEEKFTFAVGTVLAGNAYDVLCCDGDGITNPKFKVGKSDTVTLLDASGTWCLRRENYRDWAKKTSRTRLMRSGSTCRRGGQRQES